MKCKSLGIKNPRYLCPKHGEVTSVITVTPEWEDIGGDYCQRCWVDSIVKAGVPKVEKINES